MNEIFNSGLFLPLVWSIGIIILFYMMTFFWQKTLIIILSVIFLRPELSVLRDINIPLSFININMLALFSIFIIFLSTIYLLINQKQDDEKLQFLIWFNFCLFVIVGMLSIFYSLDKATAISVLFKYLTIITFLSIFQTIIKTEEDILKLYWTIVLSGVIPSTVGFYQIITKHGAYFDAGSNIYRIKSFFLMPNPYAQFLVVIIFISLFLVENESKNTKILALIFLILIYTIQLYFTFTKTSWVAFGVCLFIYSLFSKYRPVMIPVVATLLVVFLSYKGISNQFEESFGQRAVGKSSWQWRLDHWKLLFFEGIVKKPFLGWGLGSSGRLFEKLTGSYKVPHNDFIMILLETGLVGFSLFFGFLFLVFKNLLSSKNIHARLSVVLIFVLVIHMLADNVINDVTSITLIFSVIGASLKFSMNMNHNLNRETIVA